MINQIMNKNDEIKLQQIKDNNKNKYSNCHTDNNN